MEEMDWLEAEDLHLFGELGPLSTEVEVAAGISSSEDAKTVEAAAKGSDSFLENEIFF